MAESLEATSSFSRHGFGSAALISAVATTGTLDRESLWPAARDAIASLLGETELTTLPDLRARLLLRLGYLELKLGKLEDASRHLNRVVRHRHQAGQPDHEAVAHHALGYLHIIPGDIDKAEVAYTQALQLFGRTEPLRLRTQLEMGWLSFRRGHYGDAIRSFRHLIDLGERYGDDCFLHELHDRLGSALGKVRDCAEAERHLTRAYDLADRCTHDLEETRAVNLVNQAYLVYHCGEPERSLRLIARAQERFPKHTGLGSKVTLHWVKAIALRDLGQTARALSAFDRCIEAVDAIRSKSTGSSEGFQYFQTSYRNIDDAFHLLWTLHRQDTDAGYDARAFATQERIRARNLLLRISGEKTLDLSTSLAHGSADLPKARQSATPPRTTELLTSAKPGNFGDFLLPCQGLLAYYLGTEKGYWWFLDEKGLEMGLLPPREEIENAIEPYLRSLSSPTLFGLPQSHMLAASLAAKLLPDHDRIARLDRLVILPDGHLYKLPFAALPLVTAGDMPGSGSPLAAHVVLNIVPSLSIGRHLRQRAAARHLPEQTVLVLTDPVFGLEDPRLVGQATDPSFETSSLFPRLAHSRRERIALERIEGETRVEGFSGFDASLSNFLDQPLQSFRLIHLATHAVEIAEHMGYSGLIFALNDVRGMELHPNFLSAADVADLDLSADLVLSACSTAGGPLFRGEGVLGLSVAFLEAGATGVIGSLWDVEDDATATLMEHFYHHLAQGLDSAEALRAAQLALSSSERWRAPKYWAGFTLIGEPKIIFK